MTQAPDSANEGKTKYRPWSRRKASRLAPAPGRTEERKFGTFAGVFTPTTLTILGVIMYLRLPWVVGNAGLVGGLLIVALAVGITAATGLSLSSIATNTRLDAGGPYRPLDFMAALVRDTRATCMFVADSGPTT